MSNHPGPGPTLDRGTHYRISDIYAHIIPHLTEMEPAKVRREVLVATVKFLSSNAFHLHSRRILVDKVKAIAVDVSDLHLPAAVCGLALWMDRLGDINPAYVEFPDAVYDRTIEVSPLEQLRVLHYTYGLQYIDVGTNNRRCTEILVGERHDSLLWSTGEEVIAMRPATYIIIDNVDAMGKRMKGRIDWISPGEDEIEVVPYESDGWVRDVNLGDRTIPKRHYEGVYLLLPYLKPASNVSVKTKGDEE